MHYLISPCDGMILSGLQTDHIHPTERLHACNINSQR